MVYNEIFLLFTERYEQNSDVFNIEVGGAPGNACA